MATVATVFSFCEVLDRELQLGAGEADVTRGLAAYNAARRAFEALVALHPNVLGSATANVTTAANTETSSFPARFLRIDALWLLDANSRPSRKLEPISEVGGHTPNYPVILQPYLSGTSTGSPAAYYTNGTNIYWQPLPDDTHTVRCHGFQTSTDATAVTDAFPYPDIAINPIAALATRLLKTGVDDDASAQQALAQELFTPVILALSRYQRDRAPQPAYSQVHDC